MNIIFEEGDNIVRNQIKLLLTRGIVANKDIVKRKPHLKKDADRCIAIFEKCLNDLEKNS